MGKVVLQGYIVIPKSELTSVKQALITHIDLTRAEKGCLVFHVTPHEEDLYRYDVYEEFVDRLAFESHQNRVRTSEWGRVTENVERYYTLSED
ncbi:putative quinol monooxygenase [Vibrio amylolyticus]|uniref:putative quinol monooxygenase n=1 Tax=Vibrio amylolyticus TaxID=2847292 RepID=UPI0035523981